MVNLPWLVEQQVASCPVVRKVETGEHHSRDCMAAFKPFQISNFVPGNKEGSNDTE